MHRYVISALATAASIGFVSSAIAADLPAKAPIYKVPVAVPYSWAGCYIGVAGGGAWGRSRQDNSNGSSITSDFNVSGAILGGTLGCNFQAAPNWVLGLEGDLSWSSKKGTVNDIAPFNTTFTSQTKENWLSTIRARAGYTWDRWMLFATGGLALADVQINVCNATNVCASESQTRTGWTIGGGLEYGITPNWSVKAEYLYVDFGSKSYFNPAPTVSGVAFANRAGGVKLNDHLLRVGVNYRF